MNRADLLARIADEFMASGGRLPWPPLPDGIRSLNAALHPPAPAEPREVHFMARWPDRTSVCRRSLAGYSLEGGLHRVQ